MFKVTLTRTTLECGIIFLLGLLIFTSGLNHYEFVQFESRFGLFAQEMLRNGWSFFPTTYNQYYPDYPATQTILTYLLSLPFHKVTLLTTVFPTAVASALTLVFIYLIGALHSKQFGLYGVLFALFSFSFLAEARSISLDQFTTASTVCCFYCVYSAQFLHQRQRLWWIPVAWILGFAFRGPIGMIIPATIVGCFYLVEKDFKMFLTTLVSSLLLFSSCVVGLLYAAWHVGGKPFMQTVIGMQAIHRLESTAAVPVYYYFIACFIYYAVTFPLAGVTLLTYAKRFFLPTNDTKLRLLRHLGVWLLIILIGMSIPIDKKPRYILPITPAIALIAAYLFTTTARHALHTWSRNTTVWLCRLFPVFGLITLIGCGLFSYWQDLPLFISYTLLSILFCMLYIGTLLIQKKFTTHCREFGMLVIGVTTFILIYSGIAQPIDVEFNRAKPFVEHVEALRQPTQHLVFYQIGPDGEDIKFMVALDKPIQPLFLQSRAELMQFKQPAIFIAKMDNYAQLPDELKAQLTVLFTGRLGHQDCVVFKRD